MNILSLTKEATIYRLPFLITNYQIAKRRQCSQAILSKEKHIERICLLLLCLSVSFVWLFVTPWAAAHQASLSFAIFQSLLRLMSTESGMPSKHLVLCCPLPRLPSIFPSIRVFLMSHLFSSGGQSIGASASASVLPINIQGWFPRLKIIYSTIKQGK